MAAPRGCASPIADVCVCMLPAQVSRIHIEFTQTCERDCLAARAVLNGEHTGPFSGTLTISGSSDGSSTPLRFTDIAVETLYHPASSESATDLFSTRQCRTSDLASCRRLRAQSSRKAAAARAPILNRTL